MAKLSIITGINNPILRAESVKVAKFDSALKKFVKDLKDTMVAAKGLGIAAPQVGKNIRVFITTLGYEYESDEHGEGKMKGRALTMVNPEILAVSEEMEVGEEGCLSLPGEYGKVERYKQIKVEFFSEEGVRQVLELQGLDARVVQHENDHLDGILFPDRMRAGEKEEDLLM